MSEQLTKLLLIISDNDGINDKSRLARIVCETAGLTRDRSVFYCPEYAVRFSSSESHSFGNTVASLSRLQKYDDRPFVVCLVTPEKNFCFIANSTFLKKISHSSQDLRTNNIRGSFNGSDISREFEGIENTAENIERLFDIHAAIGFDGNLERLVEATNNISPTGIKFEVTDEARETILSAPKRAIEFVFSGDAVTLKSELDERVSKLKNEILFAALIENVNVRGRVIEYLIAGEDEELRQKLIDALTSNKGKGLPPFKTDNALGDFAKKFDRFDTETDVKTKLMVLNSNPKAYNLDKMLEFLAQERSIFMFYFVGVDPTRIVNTSLVSMFQHDLLGATILLRHWAGRNSRGVSQFEGRTINDLINTPNTDINEKEAEQFLREIIEL
ncbi:MAG: hypothetical protein KF756_05405 [Acidobacteria bacterium]|nr:hypothetical protein [Acidobacteriota bacterium]